MVETVTRQDLIAEIVVTTSNNNDRRSGDGVMQ